ncbi:ATP-dependent sacrificial sulfur transferase LarE [Dehalobacterium formicoaceticum]|uniref:ATP-dependent sacrificial sulfur transferase LarE n=1 Tax=Dehalobacterium formicoaceticum TaxID=51515 RepID=A0ABT1Y5C5_9FIRM|nr:ATP-dependent sacrificial sulfur transferase LarE [Dehalobacterium formicoaceticum]MCR6545124.1 ATP-dependent sacrificial sulfur transferase LarE [Dehalobacterium formicoaceticum]
MEIDPEKIAQLEDYLNKLGKVVVAFSGGVDSTFLAAVAYRALGENALAVTADSPTFSQREKQDACLMAAQIGIRHQFIVTDELNNSKFSAGPPDRCYYCKKDRFLKLRSWAEEQGYNWVIEGSNADDLRDYRPGMKGLAEVAGVKSPLLEIGFSKEEIRAGAKNWGLPVWDKPAAACLASRLAYGLPITAENLQQVELAEEIIRQFSPGQVRVRHHGNLARIEVETSSVPLLLEPTRMAHIAEKLKNLGFTYVTLDLTGYQMGSMNQTLSDTKELE